MKWLTPENLTGYRLEEITKSIKSAHELLLNNQNSESVKILTELTSRNPVMSAKALLTLQTITLHLTVKSNFKQIKYRNVHIGYILYCSLGLYSF